MKKLTHCLDLNFKALRKVVTRLDIRLRRSNPTKIISPSPDTYDVTYTKAIGGLGLIVVRANDSDQALRRAKLHCYIGSHFRDAVVTSKQYISPKFQLN